MTLIGSHPLIFRLEISLCSCAIILKPHGRLPSLISTSSALSKLRRSYPIKSISSPFPHLYPGFTQISMLTYSSHISNLLPCPDDLIRHPSLHQPLKREVCLVWHSNPYFM